MYLSMIVAFCIAIVHFLYLFDLIPLYFEAVVEVMVDLMGFAMIVIVVFLVYFPSFLSCFG